MIAVTMFGPLSVHVDGRELSRRELGGVKPRQVLAMLLLHRRAVTKDELIDWLWGDDAPRDPVATLEAYVSVLRSSLQPGVHRDLSVIATEPGAYRLVRERADIDLDRFDALVRALPRATEAERAAMLYEACTLAGAALLEDERYAEWAQGPRRQYERTRLELMVAAAEVAVERNAAVQALDLAEMAMDVDPCCEPAYHAAMRAAGLLGRRDMVARLFEQCARAVRVELGVAPMAVTEVLRDRLLAEVAPVAPALAGASVGAGTPVGAHSWAPAVESADGAVAVLWPTSRFR